MTAEIFVAMVCLASSDPKWNLGCHLPTCRQATCLYQTREECERIADLFNRGNPRRPGDTMWATYQCFRKSIQDWEPADGR